MTKSTLTLETIKRSPRVASVRNSIAGAIFVVSMTTVTCVGSDPRIDSWFTTYSGKYARIYATDGDRTLGNAVSTWSRGAVNQSIPARCGVYLVGSSTSWVYIRSTGLGSHI